MVGDDTTFGGVGSLIVEYESEVLRPARSLSFGRAGDLAIGLDNPYMHRLCGQFNRHDDLWWLANTGSRLRLLVVDDGGVFAELPPGGSTPLPGPTGVVRLTAGPTTHEIGYWVSQPDRSASHPAPPKVIDLERTAQYGTMLSPREFDVILALAERRLRGLSGPPTQQSVATLWGLKPKAVENVLTRLRERLRHEHGVRFIGSTESLVEFAIGNALVTAADLRYLDHPNGPQSASERRRAERAVR